MLKNTKKIILLLLSILLIVSTTCFAATINSSEAKLEIVENNICTININNIATFEKKIISSDLTNKEITLQLKVTNNAEKVLSKPTEIQLVIDNSLSMDNPVSNTTTRLQAVTDSAKKLATSLMENDNVKIGVVSFSTGDNEGSITDATLRVKPTDNKSNVISAIDEIANGKGGPRTNIDAGITLASQNFSSTCESKYIVILTDGVPNTAIGGPTSTFSGDTASKTLAKLKELQNSKITIFSVMTGIPNSIETTTGLSYKQLAEEIFGTMENPTVSKFYYISDNEIEKTIAETVLKDFNNTSSNTLTNLKIYDYFPQQIVDNFEFSYVTNCSKGTISPSIDLQNNMIVWTIDSLEPKDTATISYKLKLKNNIDSKIIDLILSTNEKVEITANEIKTDDGSNILSSNVTPKIRLSLVKDPTTTNTVIPQTGDSSLVTYFIVILSIGLVIIAVKYYSINKKVK